MKYIKYTLITSLAFIAFSCGMSNEDKAKTTAQEFLDAYLSTDFTKAANYCEDDIKDKLLESTNDLNSLNEQLKEHIKSTALKYKPTIDSVITKGKDSTLIVYTISLNDSLQNKNIRSSMMLIKDGKKEWKISRLGTF